MCVTKLASIVSSPPSSKRIMPAAKSSTVYVAWSQFGHIDTTCDGLLHMNVQWLPVAEIGRGEPIM